MLPSPVVQKRRRKRCPRTSSDTTSAKCTKCDILFPDVRSLGDHFAQSPAHPYCAPAPINSWSAPEKPAVPLEGRHTFPHPLGKSPPVREQNNANTTEKTVKCECGKGFKTSSALTKPMAFVLSWRSLVLFDWYGSFEYNAMVSCQVVVNPSASRG
jgi:hypothetical protein